AGGGGGGAGERARRDRLAQHGPRQDYVGYLAEVHQQARVGRRGESEAVVEEQEVDAERHSGEGRPAVGGKPASAWTSQGAKAERRRHQAGRADDLRGEATEGALRGHRSETPARGRAGAEGESQESRAAGDRPHASG